MTDAAGSAEVLLAICKVTAKKVNVNSNNGSKKRSQRDRNG